MSVGIRRTHIKVNGEAALCLICVSRHEEGQLFKEEVACFPLRVDPILEGLFHP